MINCASCRVEIDEGAIFDERTEQYFCDRQCFNDWAHDNFDDIIDFYAKLNVT